MTPRFRMLAWVAATATYLLIVFGAIVRISGSGMGCGDHWPMCNGRWFPPLDDPKTLIEWGHRFLVTVVSVPVVATAFYAWRLRRANASGAPSTAAYWALGLLIPQALLGAVTVKLDLPHWTVVLHFMTAMTMFAALLIAALGRPLSSQDRAARAALGIGFVVVLLGALTAKLDAAGACTGFPLCNGGIWPDGGLAQLHWIHRLFAYALTLHVIGWAVRSRRRSAVSDQPIADSRQPTAIGPWVILGLIMLQVLVAAGMVTAGLPPAMQALHVAVGTAVWGALVIVNTARTASSVPVR